MEIYVNDELLAERMIFEKYLIKGTTIKKIRKELGLTLVQLSQKTGISVSRISELEHEHRPRLNEKNGIRLISVLNMLTISSKNKGTI